VVSALNGGGLYPLGGGKIITGVCVCVRACMGECVLISVYLCV